HPLLHTDGQVLDDGVGVDVETEAVGDLLDPLAGFAAVDDAQRPGRLVAQGDRLGDGEDRHEHEVLVHHPDAGGHGVAGPVEGDRRAVEHDLAVVGFVQAVEHVHQRALAGPVLTEERVDLPRLDDQVDGVVGDEGPEALGDASKLEFHWAAPLGSMAGWAAGVRTGAWSGRVGMGYGARYGGGPVALVATGPPRVVSTGSRSVRRVHGDLAGDDLVLERLDLVLQFLRHLGAAQRQAHAAVLQVTDVGLAGEVAREGLLDGGEDTGTDLLDDGRHDDVAVVGGLGPVGVDTHDPHVAGVLRGGGGTQADRAGHRHDDVGTLGDELVGQRLALALVLEAAGERAVLRLLVPAEDGDVGAVVLVVLRHAVDEAVHEDADGRDRQAAEGGDGAGLGHPGGEVAGEVGGLGGVEDDRLGVVDL